MKSLKYLIVLLSSLFVSCEQGTILNSNQDVDNKEWSLYSPVVFNSYIKDTSIAYDCFISVRHTQKYEWSNLFLFIKTTYPNKEFSMDTVECILADPSGRWKGKGMGKSKDIQFLLKNQVRFPLQGNYKFEIQQGMRKDEIAGIQSIGFKITESNYSSHEK